jgi:hypothetical protein
VWRRPGVCAGREVRSKDERDVRAETSTKQGRSKEEGVVRMSRCGGRSDGGGELRVRAKQAAVQERLREREAGCRSAGPSRV